MEVTGSQPMFSRYFEEHGLRNAGGGEDCEDSLRKCGVFLLPELIKVFAEGDSSFNEV